MKLHNQVIGKICAVLCILLLTMTLAVGETEARYNNATSWTGYYDPGVQTISGDILIPEGQTVVLAPWEAIVGATQVFQK